MDVPTFFNDTLLSFLLLEKVGERRFNQLTELFKPKNLSHEGYQKITKKFLEVYRFNETVYAANQEQVESIQQQFTPVEPKSLIADSDSFDWTFLTDWLKKQHINQLTEPVLQQAKTYQQLYGFDELTLGELLLQSFDFTTEEVSLKELQRIVLLRQQQQNTLRQSSNTLVTDQSAETGVPVNQALPSAAQQLIQVARQTPPMRYLEAIKKKKAGMFPNRKIGCCKIWSLNPVCLAVSSTF